MNQKGSTLDLNLILNVSGCYAPERSNLLPVLARSSWAICHDLSSCIQIASTAHNKSQTPHSSINSKAIIMVSSKGKPTDPKLREEAKEGKYPSFLSAGATLISELIRILVQM